MELKLGFKQKFQIRKVLEMSYHWIIKYFMEKYKCTLKNIYKKKKITHNHKIPKTRIFGTYDEK